MLFVEGKHAVMIALLQFFQFHGSFCLEWRLQAKWGWQRYCLAFWGVLRSLGAAPKSRRKSVAEEITAKILSLRLAKSKVCPA